MIKNKIKDIASLAEGIFETLKEKSESLPIKDLIEMGVDMVGSQVLEAAGFTNETELRIKRLPHFKGDLPQYKTSGSSGMDVRACIDETITLEPGKRTLIPTGLAMKVSEAYEIQARPRSGLALKKGLTLLNTPGTIDADYRGEIKIIMANLGDEAVMIEDGERIAQLVICPVVKAKIALVDELDETERGEGGFGSTGSY